jgi:hypothetical protein
VVLDGCAFVDGDQSAVPELLCHPLAGGTSFERGESFDVHDEDGQAGERIFDDVISAFCFLFAEETQRITRWFTLSDRCCGISLATQLRYTPFGAMIRAKLIFTI